MGQFESVLKGHDFSRAAKVEKSTRPSGPEGCFFKLTQYPIAGRCITPRKLTVISAGIMMKELMLAAPIAIGRHSTRFAKVVLAATNHAIACHVQRHFWVRLRNVLPLRSTVGQLPLEQHIGVRIPEGQPKHFSPTPPAYIRYASPISMFLNSS